MIDAILFDLGDTIINFGIGRREAEGLFHAGARQTYDYLASRGKALPAYERYFQSHYRKMRNEYLWSKLVCRDFDYGDALATVLRRMRVSVSQEERCQIEWMWYDPIMRVSHIDAGLHDMLAELRDSGTKMGIVSNTFVPGHCLDRHLEETGLLEFFPVRVYSSGVRYRKPHPRIFEIALGRVGVEAGRTVFIGDLRGPDIRGAQRAGMKTVWKPAANAAVGRGCARGGSDDQADHAVAGNSAAAGVAEAGGAGRDAGGGGGGGCGGRRGGARSGGGGASFQRVRTACASVTRPARASPAMGRNRCAPGHAACIARARPLAPPMV